MKRTYKFRIYPNLLQIRILEGALNLCGLLYNAALEQRILAHRNGVKVNYCSQAKELPELKAGMPEYHDVFSQVLQNVLDRLDKSFKMFFGRVKTGRGKPGFPRYKAAMRYRSITYPQSGFEIKSNTRIHVSKVGFIRAFIHRPIRGEIKTMTIKKDNVGDWWAVFTSELPDREKTVVAEPKVEGIDVGINSLAVVSNDEIIPAIKFYSASQERLKIAQRNMARRQKGSKNREKARLRVAKVHRKIERQRDDYLHKASRRLVNSDADVLVFEDLKIQNMVKNHCLAKNILDMAWGKLKEYTTYKAEDAGKVVMKIDPRYTTQTCSNCGARAEISLSVRFYACPSCGFSIDRDSNASRNIKKTGASKLQDVGTDCAELVKKAYGALTSTEKDIKSASAS